MRAAIGVNNNNSASASASATGSTVSADAEATESTADTTNNTTNSTAVDDTEAIDATAGCAAETAATLLQLAGVNSNNDSTIATDINPDPVPPTGTGIDPPLPRSDPPPPLHLFPIYFLLELVIKQNLLSL